MIKKPTKTKTVSKRQKNKSASVETGQNLTDKTKKDIVYIKVPRTAVILYFALLVITSFYCGFSFIKSRTAKTVASVATIAPTAVFAAAKTDKPTLKYFVMSFCPYGNQMEDALRPVFDLFGTKVNLEPHYIFEKISDLNSYCKSTAGDPTQCAVYVQNQYFTSVSECQTTIAASLKTCQDTNSYIKAPDGTMYASLHGRQEANEDVREICAWNMFPGQKQYWDFIGNINKNCTAQNADSCWTQQAEAAGLDPNKITQCFSQNGISLIEKEITLTDQYKVQGSPTVFINDVSFPPDSAYTQDGKGTLAIGNKTATQDQYRSPNVIKTAICASFNKAPKECNTQLKDLTGAVPAAGGCGN